MKRILHKCYNSATRAHVPYSPPVALLPQRAHIPYLVRMSRLPPVEPDPRDLLDLARTRMPFGKYKGRLLVDLPEPYVVWFHQQGVPAGRLGQLFGLLYEIKVNGLEDLVRRFENPA